MAKRIAILLGILLITSNTIWLYYAIDHAVKDQYQRQRTYEAQQQIATLQSLCSQMVAGMSKSEALDLLNALTPDRDAYEKGGQVKTRWLSITLDMQGKVAQSDACHWH